jgi:hypothetical protein
VAEVYVDKLSTIFLGHKINSVTVIHMEVPCCLGTLKIVEEALAKSGKNIPVKVYNLSLQGEII